MIDTINYKDTFRFLLRVLLATLVIYFIQNFIWLIVSSVSNDKINLNNFFYGLVYLFITLFVIYYILILLYSLISIKLKNQIKERYILALFFGVAGCFLFRFGDIIDGDFLRNLRVNEIIVFFLTSLIMAWVVDRIVLKGR